ncbi:MAG: hypothetical protein ACYS8W_06970 [Planctomycetota bacterium]|jgi:hypothetical protein
MTKKKRGKGNPQEEKPALAPRLESKTQQEKASRLGPVSSSIIVLLFISGIFHWLMVFSWGNAEFKAFDFPVFMRNYRVMKQAITECRIPYHCIQKDVHPSLHKAETIKPQEERFLTAPYINLFPNVIMLAFMGEKSYTIFNVLFFYAVGFIGCMLIRKKYNLAVLPFTVMFLLFNFNGHLVSRIGYGYLAWISYFLFPFFFLYVLELLEKDKPGITVPIKISFVGMLMLAMGGFQFFTWCMMFLALVAVFDWKRTIRPVLQCFLFGGLLGLFKFIPVAVAYWGNVRKTFVGSFPYGTVNNLFDVFVTMKAPPGYFRGHPWMYISFGGHSVCLGELSIFIGLLAFLALIYLGIVLRFSKRPELEPYKFKKLDMPLVAMTFLSIALLYGLVARLPIPFIFSVNRTETRFIVIPFVFIIFISAIRMQQFNRLIMKSWKILVLVIVGILQTASELGMHSWLSRLDLSEKITYAERKLMFSVSLLEKADPFYKNSVRFSFAVSFIVFVFLVYLYIKEKKAEKARQAEPAG